jgi:hypothetical protein
MGVRIPGDIMMSELIPERDQSTEAKKTNNDDVSSKLLSSIAGDDRSGMRLSAGSGNYVMPTGLASLWPLRTIEVPADPKLDSASWVRPLPYHKGVPGTYMPWIGPRTAPDPRVEAALSTIRQDDIKQRLDQISGNTDIVVNGKTTRIESRSTHGQSYKDALQFFKEKFEKDGYQVSIDNYTRRGETLQNLRAVKVGQTKPNEIVMLGAHIDSTIGNVWYDEAKAPGADDDGSGAVAVSEIGHAIKDLPLDRTVVISLFSGEEQGLWGSRAMSELYKQSQVNIATGLDNNAAAKSPKIVAMYQLDMIGYAPGNNTVESHDTSDQAGPHALTDLLNSKVQQYNLDLKIYGAHNDELNDRSDHYNFARMGVPAVLISEPYDTAQTPNPHYHSTHDVVANLNLPYMTNITKAVTAASIELAGLPGQGANRQTIKDSAYQMMPLETRILKY